MFRVSPDSDCLPTSIIRSSKNRSEFKKWYFACIQYIPPCVLIVNRFGEMKIFWFDLIWKTIIQQNNRIIISSSLGGRKWRLRLELCQPSYSFSCPAALVSWCRWTTLTQNSNLFCHKCAPNLPGPSVMLFKRMFVSSLPQYTGHGFDEVQQNVWVHLLLLYSPAFWLAE